MLYVAHILQLSASSEEVILKKVLVIPELFPNERIHNNDTTSTETLHSFYSALEGFQERTVESKQLLR
jgi:hypothetical protein